MSAPDPATAAEPPFRRRLPPEARRRMAWALRAGLLLSLLLLAGGIAAYAVLHPGATSQGVLATNPIAGFLTFGGLVHGIARGSPEAILTLGILVLVATPIVRVASGFYYFERGGERTMSVVALAVFLLLLFGLLVFGPLVR